MNWTWYRKRKEDLHINESSDFQHDIMSCLSIRKP